MRGSLQENMEGSCAKSKVGMTTYAGSCIRMSAYCRCRIWWQDWDEINTEKDENAKTSSANQIKFWLNQAWRPPPYGYF